MIGFVANTPILIGQKYSEDVAELQIQAKVGSRPHRWDGNSVGFAKPYILFDYLSETGFFGRPPITPPMVIERLL